MIHGPGPNTGVGVSRHLLWLMTKNHNCHIYKARNVKQPFTRDPLNPKGIQTFRWSGSIQNKALSVTSHTSKKGIVMIYRKTKHQLKPKKSLEKVPLVRDNRRSYRHIRKFVNKNFYRKDLKMVWRSLALSSLI